MMQTIEKYDFLELTFEVSGEKELILDGVLFSNGDTSIRVPAFRKREQEYAVRFMPKKEGIWTYQADILGVDLKGEFTCTENTGENHGCVQTEGGHFRYEDGSCYIPFGTTSYAWLNQPEELQDQTVETLSKSPFNKIRMGIFPKSMPYNQNDPEVFPFQKRADGSWDVENPEPAFWDNVDYRMGQLLKLGIEVDLILFHPYDRWGFAELSQADSMRYLEYCTARLAAYRNLWWSLANEYELLSSKSMKDWEEYGEWLAAHDSCHHLISVHNILNPFPKRDWLTHCSIQMQFGALDRIPFWKQSYGLPVVIDECGYEGDLIYNWGSLTAFEMVHRFWQTVCRGGFCTHGETYHREDEILWWAKGGRLHGESAERIGFLKELLYGLGGEWTIPEYNGKNPNLDPGDEEAKNSEDRFQKLLEGASQSTREMFLSFTTPMKIMGENWELQYFGRTRPVYFESIPKDGAPYQVELIDIWEMTRKVVFQGSGEKKIPLPAKEGMAVLCMRI